MKQEIKSALLLELNTIWVFVTLFAQMRKYFDIQITSTNLGDMFHLQSIMYTVISRKSLVRLMWRSEWRHRKHCVAFSTYCHVALFVKLNNMAYVHRGVKCELNKPLQSHPKGNIQRSVLPFEREYCSGSTYAKIKFAVLYRVFQTEPYNFES
jgi:hypothetical protein